jgi:hypothetical protein
MTRESTVKAEAALAGNSRAATTWSDARRRLAESEPGRHSWLATVRPDGGPHLMPILAFWMDGALHFLAGEGTRKGRNLAADGRCVIATESRSLPSMDIVVEGRAEPVTDADEVRRLAQRFNASGWPLEPRGAEVHGPNAPTAGPPPYRIFRVEPIKAFGLPGTYGMEQFRQEDLPNPMRWEFADA